MFTVTINSIDRTSDILYNTFRISDYINQQVDTCSFECKKFKPSLNQEISVEYNSDIIFGGVIVKVETEVKKGENIYKVTCKDYSQYLNRRLVSERYSNKTVGEIIHDIIGEYATDFTVDSAGLDDITHRYKLIQDSTDSIGSDDGTDTDMTYSGGVGNFNGSSSKITIGSIADFNKQEFSFSVRVKVDASIGSDAGIFDNLAFDSGNIFGWCLDVSTGKGIEFIFGDGTATPRSYNLADQYNYGEWNTIGVTFDRPNIKLYLNGVLLGTQVRDYDISYTTVPTAVIGKRTDFFKGQAGDIRFYDRVLDDSEMMKIHEQPLDNNITQITFNRINTSQCLQALAELVNYSWYVDYEKDIHFFAENEEIAPFNLSESAGNHNWESLKIIEDFSQIRNQIYIIGGDSEADPRIEEYVADGEQKQFPLAYKYSSISRVRIVGDADLTVGVDGQDEEADFNVFWSGNKPSQYIRFKDSNYPDADDVVEVTGVPLFPVLVKVPDVSSISTYGLYEFKIKDTQITSRADAIARGVVELEAYANSIEEASFITDTYGLKSGQTININIGDTNEDFIIQSVNMNMKSPFAGQWAVKLATVRTLGIIRFLQKYLKIEDDVTEGEVLLELQQFEDASVSSDEVVAVTTHTSQDYYWGDDDAESYDSYWDFSTYD